MLLVPTKSLKIGMTLAQPIFHPSRAELVLLARDHTFDSGMIARLRQLNVTHVWIHVPNLEELDEKINPAISEHHVRLFSAVENSINKLERCVALPMNVMQYKKCVRNLLSEIIVDPDHEVVTYHLASCSPMLAGHLTNCCYLSLLVGAHLSGYLRDQRRTLPVQIAENTSLLGLGALLHDIGKLKMPEEHEQLCIIDEEANWPEYKMHVQVGFEMVRETVSVVAANVVLNHHQRFDGLGFPVRESSDATRQSSPLAGERIHIFSRIVAVVDIFDRLLCRKGTPIPTICALRTLRSNRFRGWFDPVIVQKLFELVPPFLVGSTLTLDDGTEAVVMENHPEAPCRPTVRLLDGPITSGRIKVRGKQIDLRMARTLSIAAVDGVDVRPQMWTGELEPPVHAGTKEQDAMARV